MILEETEKLGVQSAAVNGSQAASKTEHQQSYTRVRRQPVLQHTFAGSS